MLGPAHGASAGLPEVRLQDLRHSLVSVGAAGGFSLPTIGALLGHRHATTTAHYAHLSADPLCATNDAVDARIAAAMNGAVEMAAPTTCCDRRSDETGPGSRKMQAQSEGITQEEAEQAFLKSNEPHSEVRDDRQGRKHDRLRVLGACDLWLVGREAIRLMDLLHHVAQDAAGREGRSILEFRSDFRQTPQGLARESLALSDELKASDR
jgi:hypothetical protein